MHDLRKTYLEGDKKGAAFDAQLHFVCWSIYVAAADDDVYRLPGHGPQPSPERRRSYEDALLFRRATGKPNVLLWACASMNLGMRVSLLLQQQACPVVLGCIVGTH
eukprot:1143634-Pelagomonas_calceolata.AAC.6